MAGKQVKKEEEMLMSTPENSDEEVPLVKEKSNKKTKETKKDKKKVVSKKNEKIPKLEKREEKQKNTKTKKNEPKVLDASFSDSLPSEIEPEVKTTVKKEKKETEKKKDAKSDPRVDRMKKAIKEEESEDVDSEEVESEPSESSEEESELSEKEEEDSEEDDEEEEDSEEDEEKDKEDEKMTKVNNKFEPNSNTQSNQTKRIKENPAQTGNSNPEIIIGNLPFNATEEDIRKQFKACGEILSVRIMMGQDGRPRGKAFVKFSNLDEMNKAIDMNGTNFNGRELFVEQTRPRENQQQGQNRFQANGNKPSGAVSTNVIVRNLPFSVNEDQLRNQFQDCGNIKNIRIMTDENGRSRGFGFVDFYDNESSGNALKKNGINISGRAANIEYSLPRGPGGFTGGRGGSQGFNRNNQHQSNQQQNQRKGFVDKFQGEQVDL